jgi:enterochelin esterase-like enzyme
MSIFHKHILKFLQILFILTVPAFLNAQTPKVSNGTIKHFENVHSNFIKSRNIDVWLPEGYDPKKKYAVLYIQDGRGLFDSTIMWNKQEWGVDEHIGKLLREKKINECIVVGIWNGEEIRRCEFFPQKAFESLNSDQQKNIYQTKLKGELLFKGLIQSDLYLKFIVKEVKPFIDSSFSTFHDPNHTFVAGSSMGGLISLYALCEYPEIFGGAACLSTHWTVIYQSENNPIPAALINYLSAHLPSAKNHKVYFDYGNQTLDTLYKPFQLKVDQLLKTKGYSNKNWMTKEYIGDDHSEKSWNRRLDNPLLFLLPAKH